MGFLVINKHTGEVVFNKIYTTDGKASAIINQGQRQGNLREAVDGDLVVVPMPSASVLRKIANGSWYGTVRNGGKYPLEPIEFDND